jgi:ABC-type nitrate/sulfonate/bicarbonate transport system substrate-binding protein
MKLTRRDVLKTLGAVPAGLTLANALPSFADDATTVRLGWIGDTHFTDMYLIPQYLKDKSITLNQEKFVLSQDEVNALTAGSLDMAAVGYIFFLKMLDAGQDVVAVSGVSEKGTRILIRNGVTVKSWADLAKLRVGIARGSTQDLQLRSALIKHNVDLNSVNFVIFTNAVDMMVGLQRNLIDVASLWEPQASKAIKDGIATEFEKVYPYSWSSNGMLVARADFLKAHPVAVQEIVAALYASSAKLTADHAYWVAQAANFAPVPSDVQQLAVENSGQSVVLHYADLVYMSKMMFDAGYLKHEVPASTIAAHVDYSILEKATGKKRMALGAPSA